MYKYTTQVKLCSILVIVLTMQLQGCATTCASKDQNPQVSESTKGENPSKTFSNNYGDISSNDYDNTQNEIPLAKTFRVEESELLEGKYEPLETEKPTKKRTQKRTQTQKDYHTVQRGETLFSIAKRYGQNYHEVATWNQISSPSLLEIGQRLRITKPKTDSKAVKSEVSSSPKTDAISHVVQGGETLFSIAQRYGYTVTEIAKWNGLEPPYTLSLGRHLQVEPPQKSTQSPQSSHNKTVQSNTDKPANYHTVVKGDTLYNIAQRYGSNVNEIAVWNHLQAPYTLSLGQRLQVTSSAGIQQTPSTCKLCPIQQQAKPTHHNTGYHTVVQGNTLFSLSKKYGYTVPQIASWNRLQPPYELSVGQRLRVYPPSGILKTITRQKNTSKRQSSSTRHHIVKPGDTLTSIATQYGLSAYDLSNWNGIGSPYTLYPGQKLSLAPH